MLTELIVPGFGDVVRAVYELRSGPHGAAPKRPPYMYPPMTVPIFAKVRSLPLVVLFWLETKPIICPSA